MRSLSLSVVSACLLAACSTSSIDGDVVADALADSRDARFEQELREAVEVSPEALVDPEAATLTVMTFNVLCFFCNDIDYDPWEDRVVYIGDLIGRHNPDLIGLQELTFGSEVEQILAEAPGYSALFFTDPEQDLFKEFADATILYRADRFEVVESGHYWLSETPDVPLSGGWADTNIPRQVTWAHLRQKSDGRELYFASTHFDNNPPNQDNSAPLFVARTAQWSQSMPAIVVGDFNSKPSSTAYGLLTAPADEPVQTLKNTFDLAAAWRVETNQEPTPEYDPSHRIDHMFVAGEADWEVAEWVVDMTVYGPDDRYPSDHFAMATTLTW